MDMRNAIPRQCNNQIAPIPVPGPVPQVEAKAPLQRAQQDPL